jgi:signal transduction histidine kinase
MPMMSRGDEDKEWPRSVPLVAFFVILLTVGTAVAQRAPQGLRWPVVYALIALSPFIVDIVKVIRRVDFEWDPLWLFPIPVLIGIGLLVWHPPHNDFAPFALSFMTAEVTSRAGDRRWLGVATALASIGVMVAADVFGHYSASYIWAMGIGFGYFAGLLIQSFVRRTNELREAQGGLEEKAAAEERSRIAREVHDVIAHSMSVTMLHVTAARMALERGRSQDALDALQEAEQQGRRSLGDIRRTVGLLGPDESGAAPPQPGVTDLAKLIGDYRAAGLDVALRVDGHVEDVPPAAALSVYRIVQESLTNAAKHAPGAPATVELHVDDEIRLVVSNGRANGASAVKSSDGGM